MISLAGKAALITGGSRGIGAASVRAFAQAGADVVFNYIAAAKPLRNSNKTPASTALVLNRSKPIWAAWLTRKSSSSSRATAWAA